MPEPAATLNTQSNRLTAAAHPTAPSEAADACEMALVAPVRAGEEVFNTYGAGLSNAQLLARYGFMLDGNEHDVVSWDGPEALWRRSGRAPALGRRAAEAARPDTNIPIEEPAVFTLSASTRARVVELYAQIIVKWPADARWNGSEMVFNPTPGTGRDGRDGAQPILAVNADGRVSHGLWVLAALVAHALIDTNIGETAVGDILGALDRAATRQLAREAGIGPALDDQSAEAQIAPDMEPIAGAGARRAFGGACGELGAPYCAASGDGLLAQTLHAWCAARRGRIGARCVTSAELGARLDVSACVVVPLLLGSPPAQGTSVPCPRVACPGDPPWATRRPPSG